ncbi:T9SS type A sorting domain-containing protein [Sporocytophaga sp.]|uniref:T9SS type A sorting domain-containing protein n=1 Tax=Sporocytophaga sp. TaxID=2231183 RepID=UPI0025EFAD08|nr:T9SS type A sorting domain-containing protein [Sporocytophaga sp.]
MKKIIFLCLLMGVLAVQNMYAQCIFPYQTSGLFTKPNVAEVRLLNVSYSTYRAKYDALWADGWRLHDLNVSQIARSTVYSAVWRKANVGEYQIYGADWNTFINYYNPKFAQGWRINTIASYADNNNTLRYTVSFRQTYAQEFAIYGWSQTDLINKYNEVKGSGWRLKTLNSFLVNNQLRYTAVFEQSTSAESFIVNYTQADFVTKFNQMHNNGWHVHSFDTYFINGQLKYSVIFRPGAATEVIVANYAYSDFINTPYYNSSGYASGWRLDEVSISGNPNDVCNDVIGIGVTERVAAVEEEEALEVRSGDIEDIYSSEVIKTIPSHSADGLFNLSIDNVSNAASIALEVVDFAGKAYSIEKNTYSLSSGQNEIMLNLSGFPAGGYLVKMNIGEASVTRKVFIVR